MYLSPATKMSCISNKLCFSKLLSSIGKLHIAISISPRFKIEHNSKVVPFTILKFIFG